jgi:hypothetical protein
VVFKRSRSLSKIWARDSFVLFSSIFLKYWSIALFPFSIFAEKLSGKRFLKVSIFPA